MEAPPCPIIDADDIEWLSRCVGSSACDPEQRVVADWKHQPSSKACCRTSAQRETEMMNNAVEPPGSSRRWRQDITGKSLHEDLPAAQHGVAPEATRNDHKLGQAAGETCGTQGREASCEAGGAGRGEAEAGPGTANRHARAIARPSAGLALASGSVGAFAGAG
jgi:hypothetical protein